MTLTTAVLRENLEEVRMALRAGESTEQRDEAGRTPLIHSAIDGLADIARVLLAGGADANAVDGLGMAPLHYAVQGGHLGLARALLDKNANPNMADKNGNTPLHMAVFRHNGSETSSMLLQALIAGGANMGISNRAGVSPEDLARSRGFDMGSVPGTV